MPRAFFVPFFFKHSGLAAWHFDCPKPVHTLRPLKSIVIGREGIMSLPHLRESEQLRKPKSCNNKTKLEYLTFILALYHQRCQRTHSYSLCSRWQLICGRPSWLMGLLPPLLEGSLFLIGNSEALKLIWSLCWAAPQIGPMMMMLIYMLLGPTL